MKKHPWYRTDVPLSYNAIINMIVGARGLGKTYGFEKHHIRRALEHGEEFIYLRRYVEELKTAKDTFFNAVGNEFPEWDFRVNGMVAEAAHEYTRDQKKRPWKKIGYFVSLSTAQRMKSVSFAQVHWILFDEFIIEKGLTRYLPNEVTALLNFYSTVDRNQDRVRVFMLANSVSIMNPYFIEWDIQPDQMSELETRRNGFLLIHFPDSADFKQSVSNTRFGRFIAGSEYEAYAVGNQFSDGTAEMVEVKPPHARHVFNIETRSGKFSVWNDFVDGEWYAQQKLPKGSHTLYTNDPARMGEGKVLVSYAEQPLSTLRTAFKQGRVLFDKPQTRNSFIEIFKR